ncbi:MAG: hypothetical protein DWQ49_15705 [Bacteroidetes bacterium]|nr:MAG: hypothetical protein DWQ49_15705 [Bacteroidota bacterium]
MVDDTNYITFFTDEDGENLECKFNITNMDQFLSILALVLSGSITEDVIELIFEEIDDEEVKNIFVSRLLTDASNNLNSEKQKPVISASEFSI